MAPLSIATPAGAYLTSYAVTRGYGDYPGLGWTVIARQPESTAFARARELAGIIAWLGVAGGAARHCRRACDCRPHLAPDPGDHGACRPVGARSFGIDAAAPVGFGRSRAIVHGAAVAAAAGGLRGTAHTGSGTARQTENALQFSEDMRALRKLADTDALTNLMNRRAFLAAGGDAWNSTSATIVRWRWW